MFVESSLHSKTTSFKAEFDCRDAGAPCEVWWSYNWPSPKRAELRFGEGRLPSAGRLVELQASKRRRRAGGKSRVVEKSCSHFTQLFCVCCSFFWCTNIHHSHAEWSRHVAFNIHLQSKLRTHFYKDTRHSVIMFETRYGRATVWEWGQAWGPEWRRQAGITNRAQMMTMGWVSTVGHLRQLVVTQISIADPSKGDISVHSELKLNVLLSLTRCWSKG